MCGIIGYSGPRSATEVVLESLARLEYRGYDSAGIAVLDVVGNAHPTIVKSDGRVKDLSAKLELKGMPTGHVAIGHTRWATHGRPSIENAHPHQDCTGCFSLIHNGIIENYRDLKHELLQMGHIFTSDTDSEVLVHLIEQSYSSTKDLTKAVEHALSRVEGAYALVVVSSLEPDTLIGARLHAPLVVGKGNDEVFISSDITALVPYTHTIYPLNDGEMVVAKDKTFTIRRIETATPIQPIMIQVDWDATQVERGGYPHFMLKEIFEQPDALRNALLDRVFPDGSIHIEEMPSWLSDASIPINDVIIVACGSALYAGMVAKHALEKFTDLHVRLEVASEFRYYHAPMRPHTVVLAISQSGETADTYAAILEAHRVGATVIAITNAVGSAIAREADGVIMMQAGPEIGVAATKTFVTQEACGLMWVFWLATVRGWMSLEEQQHWGVLLKSLPPLLEQACSVQDAVRRLAQRHAHVQDALYIARGMDMPLAYEGALKLKEVSYIHAEAYPAGELKHGPIALIDDDVPIIAIAAQKLTIAKMVSSVQEVIARDAPVIAVIPNTVRSFDEIPDISIVTFPAVDELLVPIVGVVPLQLLAYHLAVERGCDVDQPRNLAKSVTVE